MSEFIAGTTGILTTYGLNKINEIIVGNNNANFTKIFISDKVNILDETKTLNDMPYNYVFTIDEVKNNISDKVLSITATIPPDITNFDIRTIGVICTEKNVDNLFAYTSVTLTKPNKNDVPFTLEIKINYNVGIITFNSNNLSFNLSKIKYIDFRTFNSVKKSYNTNVVSLEKNHIKNADITGNNKPQYVYKEQNNFETINNSFQGIVDYINIYNIINQQGINTNITDAFYNQKDFNYSSYKLLNLSNFKGIIENKNISSYKNGAYNTVSTTHLSLDYENSSYIDVNNDLMKSDINNISCINKTLLIQLCIDDKGTETDGIILQKIQSTNTNNSLFILKKIDNQLDIKIGFISGYINATTQLNAYEFKDLAYSLFNLVITCEINPQGIPILKLYINGIEKETMQGLSGVYTVGLQGDFTLVNYDISKNNYTNNDNYINKIICIDRVLTSDEVYSISLLK